MRNFSFKQMALLTLGLAALAAFTWAGSPIGISATGQRDAPIDAVAAAAEPAAAPETAPAEPEAAPAVPEGVPAEPEAAVAEPAEPEAAAAEPEAVVAEPEAAATDMPPVPTPPPGLDDAVAEAEEEALVSGYESSGREAGRRHKRAVLAALSGAWLGVQSTWVAAAEATGGVWNATQEASANAWRATRDASADAWRATWEVSADAWRYTRESVKRTLPASKAE